MASHNEAGFLPETLLLAVHRGEVSVVIEIFAQHPTLSPDFVDTDGITGERNKGASLLYLAVRENHLDVAHFLLLRGAQVHIGRRPDGRPPVYMAAYRGHLDSVIALMSAGTDDRWSELPIEDQISVFHAATAGNRCEIGFLLLELGMGCVNPTPGGARWTPLHVASQKGSAKFATFLLENHADVDAVSTDGQTSLFVASRKGRIDLAVLLLKSGADAQKDCDVLPGCVACRQGHVDVLEGLLTYGAMRQTWL